MRISSVERGFSLIETLVAASILTVGVSALAQLLILSTRANASAAATTAAVLLARQKMEELRGLRFGFDLAGNRVSDTSLVASPPGAFGACMEGFCDFVDRFGRPAGGGTAPPRGAAYIRRWSIEALPANPDDTLLLQVRVARAGAALPSATAGARVPDEARLVSVRTRKGA